VLELGAIHLDHRPRISEQHFRRGFHHPRFASPGRPKEQQVPHWPTWRVQTGAKHLVQVYDGLHRFVLPYNLSPQPSLEPD
jgi:hypothetical protein